MDACMHACMYACMHVCMHERMNSCISFSFLFFVYRTLKTKQQVKEQSENNERTMNKRNPIQPLKA